MSGQGPPELPGDPAPGPLYHSLQNPSSEPFVCVRVCRAEESVVEDREEKAQPQPHAFLHKYSSPHSQLVELPSGWSNVRLSLFSSVTDKLKRKTVGGKG